MASPEFRLANAEAFVGRELGVSAWVTMDQHRIDQFADCTEDHQWIHTDIERAKRDSPLGITIAHGYLTLAILAPSTFEIVVRPAILLHVVG
jgi:acyl dehydratase